MAATQTYKNHTRWFPLFHFIATPILVANLLNGLRHLWMNPNRSTGFAALVAFGLLAGLSSARAMALKVQDRVIRLELRLRLSGLLPSDLAGRINDLTPEQMVAMRFASDKELPDLMRDVLAGKLATPKDIKLAIRDWQGDYLRA